MHDLGLSPAVRATCERLIASTLLPDQNVTVWVFGSRARGDFRPYSDIDLLIDASTPLRPGQLARLRERLEASNLPYKIDLVAEDELYPAYAAAVRRERRILARLRGDLAP